MNTTQTGIKLSGGEKLIITIVRDLDTRAAKATGTERARLEAAVAAYRRGDVVKRLRKQGIEV